MRTPEKIVSEDEDKWDFGDDPKSPAASKSNKIPKNEPSEIEESYANDSFEEEENKGAPAVK